MSVLELFSAKRVDSFQYVRDEEIGVLIQRVCKACEDGESVKFDQLFGSTSNNIVSRCVLGEKFEDENGKSRIGDVSRKILELFTEFCVGDFFPGFGWVDVVRGIIGKMKRNSEKLDGFFEDVIEEHRRKMSVVGYKSDDRKDFVDIMLQLQQDNLLDHHFSRDALKAMLLVFFLFFFLYSLSRIHVLSIPR